MRRAPLLLAVLVAGVTGCAAVALRGEPDPREQLAQGVSALEARDYARARSILEPLYYQRWNEPVGQQAMLTLIAAELDGRNPERRLSAAANMATRLLNIQGVQPWMLPVAETYYLLALELGAAEEQVAAAHRARAAAEARSLPTSPREPVPAQIQRLTAQRDEARREAERLNTQLTARDKELKDTKAELERVKKTIRP